MGGGQRNLGLCERYHRVRWSQVVYIDLKISANALNKELRFIMCQRKYGPRHCIRMNYT